MDGEVRGQSDSLGIFAQEPRPNAVKRSRPWKCDELITAGIKKRAKDATRATFELHRCTPAERQQQQTIGICAFAHEIGDAMGECVGLARPRASDDQQRRRVCVQRAVNAGEAPAGIPCLVPELAGMVLADTPLPDGPGAGVTVAADGTTVVPVAARSGRILVPATGNG